MTVTSGTPSDVDTVVETVAVTIDGVTIDVPKGTLVIRAAEQLGIEIPRFCDHPLLEPVAACRMCLVDIEGVPKPQPSCAQVVSDGMQVRTQLTSPIAREAQEGVMEFLLVNHPLDCPVCDKGGECPLQNQAMSAGRPASRFEGTKREFDKPVPISPEILLDRERCVSCARCTRFAEQIAGDPMIELLERGSKQQVGIAADEPFDSYFSGNTVQICPVGALTAASYRFRARPFDLVSVPTGCEHCASGCALRTDYRRSTVTRRLAWDDPEVNQDWNCDKGRFAFAYETLDRLDAPMIRENGQLRAASWPEAIAAAAAGLRSTGTQTGVLVGGRATREDAYAYARLARGVLHSDAVDFRARLASDEEADFLAQHVAGASMAVTYGAIDAAPFILLVDFEPEDESPIVFLRLRAAARAGRTCIVTMSPIRSRGAAKMQAGWWPVLPATLADDLRSLASGSATSDQAAGVLTGLRSPGAVILVGERAAASPQALSAVVALAGSTGARLAWVPRRAGERGALDAGALAGLLPGGRPLGDATARAQVAAVWGVSPDALPQPGGPMTTQAILAAVASGALRGLIVAGLELDDLPDPRAAAAAVAGAEFVVSLEQRPSVVTDLADVILPVASVAEKAGSFVNWEGRIRPFPQVLRDALSVSDSAVLGMIADELGWAGGRWDTGSLRRELEGLGPWAGARATAAAQPTHPAAPAVPAGDTAVLVSHRLLIDAGALQTGEPHLAATARPTVALVAAGTARGASVTLTGPAGSLTLPVAESEVAAGAIWVPLNSLGCRVYSDLGLRPGDPVNVTWGGTR